MIGGIMKNLFTFLIFVLTIFAISCSDETNNVNNKVIPCLTIDECDDGLQCINGFCGEEVIQPECIDNSGCPTGFECNDAQECVKKLCESKSDCGTGSICVNTNCISGCETINDCDDGEKCDFETKKCVEDTTIDCRIENNCEQGYECDNLSGECKLSTSCNADEDCGANSKCVDNSCIPRTACVIENDNAECTGDEICKPDGFCGIDNGCENNDYCMNLDPTKPACNVNSGICYECIDDSFCTDGKKCDLTRYTCGDLTCLTDSDCGLNRVCQDDGTCVSMFGAECESDNDCTDLERGKCLTSSEPKRCVQCLQDDQCDTAQICNANTYLCEEMGSGSACTDDTECNTLAGESCVNGQCYNPNSSGNEGVEGFCDEELGGTLCFLLGGSCNGDILTNPNCDIASFDFACGDCIFE
jgi:hypothetical protein